MQCSVVSQPSVCSIQALQSFSLLLPSLLGPSSHSVMVYVLYCTIGVTSYIVHSN